jgi:hypothetical protein
MPYRGPGTRPGGTAICHVGRLRPRRRLHQVPGGDLIIPSVEKAARRTAKTGGCRYVKIVAGEPDILRGAIAGPPQFYRWAGICRP